MDYTADEIRQLRHQLHLLKELVGPVIHNDGVLPDGTVKEFFEGRDDTVEDATQLTKMFVSALIAMSNPEINCTYFHEVELAYERDLGSNLN